MEKKEAVIINCSEVRTEGTSRPSVGMFPLFLPAADGGKKLSPLQPVPALDFTLLTYLLCL